MFLGCKGHTWAETIEKSNKNYQVWSHKSSTFFSQKNATFWPKSPSWGIWPICASKSFSLTCIANIAWNYLPQGRLNWYKKSVDSGFSLCPIIGTNWIKCWMQGLGKDTDMRFAKKKSHKNAFRIENTVWKNHHWLVWHAVSFSKCLKNSMKTCRQNMSERTVCGIGREWKFFLHYAFSNV